MGPIKPVVMAVNNELTIMGLGDWVGRIGLRLAAGERVLTLFGRPDGSSHVITTAVLQSTHGRLSILRARALRTDSFDALTARHPSVQMFERELWEQTGLTPAGHPWLKPVRYEGDRQQTMHAHPFFSVRGEEIHEVGVGPIHASVIEPGHFRFMCHGEQVHHLELQFGYQHRGVEALLLKRPLLSLSSTVESIAGDSSIAYAWGHCAALEALSDTQVSMATERVRGIALELERVAMHLSTLTGLATDIAFLQGGATYGRLRTAIINATMRICGSRFGRGWLRPGGVRFGIDAERRNDLLVTLADFSRDMAEINNLMLTSRSVQSRFKGIGTVSRQTAEDIGLVGLSARASGVAIDMRSSLPGRLYESHPLALLTEETGDCWARMQLRMWEVEESVHWVTHLLDTPDLPLDSSEGSDDDLLTAIGPLWHNTLCISIREGFRGPVVQALETGADGLLVHYKLQDPSLVNWFGLTLAMRDSEITEFPICNKSFDLSYCGNDL
ncbi:MAG: hypothetical protein OJI74_03535 [Rhodanobacter thiooxydans]|nr:hypothetical protein [Rhodanobacter thiooxydans]